MPVSTDNSGRKPPVETNYDEHQENPRPSKEAVNEDDRDGASKILKWIIPAAIVILLIIWLFFKK